MLDLDSTQWSELKHAYGAAGNVPALLRAVAAKPYPKLTHTDEPWFTLWSALCHQGNIYTASYAAVPHLVHIATQTQRPCAWDLFALPASIESARLRGAAPPVPPFILGAYRAAIAGLHEAVFRHSSHSWDHTFTQAALAALAAASGNALLAEAALELSPEAAASFLQAQTGA